MLSAVALAQNQPDAAALINTSIANAEQNAKTAFAYTFQENYHVTTKKSSEGSGLSRAMNIKTGAVSVQTSVANADNGGVDDDWSIQYDVLFIEGIPYRRLISTDHKPLTPEVAASESKRYDATVASIHEMSPRQRLQMLKNDNTLMIDPTQLTSQYDCKIDGHQKVRKRPATVVQCRLRADAPAPTDATAAPISNNIKLWVDDQQPFFVRTHAVLNHIDKSRKLTNLTVDWSLIDGVWHQTSTELDWVSTSGTTTRGTIVDVFSDFKKFRTEAKLLHGYTAVVPLPPEP